MAQHISSKTPTPAPQMQSTKEASKEKSVNSALNQQKNQPNASSSKPASNTDSLKKASGNHNKMAQAKNDSKEKSTELGKQIADMAKAQAFQDILTEEMPFTARKDGKSFAKEKAKEYVSPKSLISGFVNTLTKHIPFKETVAFLTEKETGNAMRSTTLNNNAGANPLAKELTAAMTGHAINQQQNMVISEMVTHFSKVTDLVVPSSSTMTPGLSGLAQKAAEKGIDAAETVVKKGAEKALKKALKQKSNGDEVKELSNNHLKLKNGNEVALANQSAVKALMRYLATPSLTMDEMKAKTKNDSQLNDLIAAETAKGAMIEQLGGYPDMTTADSQKKIDHGVNNILLRLMTTVDSAYDHDKTAAFQMLVDLANKGEKATEQQEKTFNAALNKNNKDNVKVDLNKLLEDPQVRSQSGKSPKGFNYHNAMLLASRITDSNSFDYKLYEGRTVRSLYQQSPVLTSTPAPRTRSSAIGSEQELTMKEMSALNIASNNNSNQAVNKEKL